MTRLLNIVTSIVGLLACAPIILIFSILIRIESPGSPIFAQTRVGKDQRAFTCLKLRTMYRGTREAASHLVGESEVTKLGRLLRKTKLDELPQFWNVLVGDMNFVGPRPCLPNQKKLIAERAERNVFSVRPGVTGLAQVMGVDMSNPRKLAEIDGRYIETQSFGRDVKICLATLRGSGFEDRVKS